MIDQYGLVVQTNGDGGDCPCRCGVVIGYQHEMDMFENNAKNLFAISQQLEPSKDVYWRYPTTYNQTNDFSRDQASRLMCGFGIAGMKDNVRGYYQKLAANNFKHQNGDLIGTGEPGNIIRALNWWVLYPLLVILDLKFFVDIIAYRWQSWDYDNLFLMDLYFAKIKFWTPTAWLARKLYNKTAAQGRVLNNLSDANGNNGCAEALTANLWFISQL